MNVDINTETLHVNWVKQSIQEENCAEGMYVGNGEKYVNSVIS
jgi:hypothetical protein